jgi:hypothetical protein
MGPNVGHPLWRAVVVVEGVRVVIAERHREPDILEHGVIWLGFL